MEKGSMTLEQHLEAATIRKRELKDLAVLRGELNALLKDTQRQGEAQSAEISRLRGKVVELERQINELFEVCDSFDLERARFQQDKAELMDRIVHNTDVLDDLEKEVQRLKRRRKRRALLRTLGFGTLGFVGGIIAFSR